MSLIPHADAYIRHNLNVLLIAKHGVGKTESVLSLARDYGLSHTYYSCALLDPWTDLVGVPMPAQDPETGEQRLTMLRPEALLDTELLFLDELNRADSKTLNAVFELVQFRSLNGERLPRLRAVWAAINPPGGDYQVEDLDPALLDRFDAYVELVPNPSVPYLAPRLGRGIAEALVGWWNEHDYARRDDESYISPRRLEKLGHVFLQTGQVRSALPPWGTYDHGKLLSLLRVAKQAAPEHDTRPGIGAGPSRRFRYTPVGIKRQATELAEFLREHPDALETHRAVLTALAPISGNKLVAGYADVLDAVLPAVLEAWYAEQSKSRRTRLHNAMTRLAADHPERFSALTRLPRLLISA